jgi:lipoprotein-releasing system permease protein
MSFEFFIGARYLRAKQKQAFISLITILSIAGVTVGVMALIVVIAVMAGFEADLKSRILGVESHLVVMRHGGGFKEYRKVIDYIESVEGVEAATPVIFDQVMLRTSSGASGVVLRGIDPESVQGVVNNLTAESLDGLVAQERPGTKEPPGPGIILGKELSLSLGAVRGDLVYVISPRGMLSPIGHVPSMKPFRVVGTFESGMYDYDGSIAYIQLSEAQKLLRIGDAVSALEVRLFDIDQAANITKQVIDHLGFPYWAKNWMDMNRNLFSALKLEKTVMFIILALIVMVAAFNIASSLIMMVMEKTKDIAILKTMGASDKSIRKIFVLKGMVIGATGTALGVIFGFILCLLLERYKFIELPSDVYYITTLPVLLQVWDVVAIAGAALVICYLATLYPARQASRLNPVDALRYG